MFQQYDFQESEVKPTYVKEQLLQNKDGVANTLGTTNYLFSLFFMKNYFVFKVAS